MRSGLALLVFLAAVCSIQALSHRAKHGSAALNPDGMQRLVKKVEEKEGVVVGRREQPPDGAQVKVEGKTGGKETGEEEEGEEEERQVKEEGGGDDRAVGEKDKATGERDVEGPGNQKKEEGKQDKVIGKSAPTECLGSAGSAPRCGVLRLACPHRGGVCCAGGTHCCPHGYECASLEASPNCPQCVKAKLTCPGLHSHKSTGLHPHAKKGCGADTEERNGGHKKDIPAPGKPEARIEKKEEESPAKPVDKKEEEMLCRAWWAASNTCPDGQTQNRDVAGDSCAEGECRSLCCKEEEAPVMTCSTFFDDGECPARTDRNTDNDDEKCDKQSCLRLCCKPEPHQTCDAFWSKDNACPAPSTKVMKNRAQKCATATCPEVCCEATPSCKDWLDDGGRCDAGMAPDPQHKATRCSKDSCQAKCCKKMPPKPLTCWEYWEDNTCEAPRTEAIQSRKSTKCLPKNCPTVCCQPPPPTCAKFFLADGKGCPTNGEYVERQEHKNTACRSDQECLSKCCTKLPPKCSTWFNENTCKAPRIRDSNKDNTRCHGAECEASCCKQPPPFRCAHFWAKEQCPANRPLKNEAHKQKECKANGCIEMCCKQRPPPPPTCALHFLLEKCAKQQLLRRTENTFRQCNGAQCNALCCKKPPPFVRRRGQCDWSGDPHWWSFDRVKYDWYGVGEYALYVDPYTNERAHIKTGNSPWARHVSWTTGLAMRVDNDAISFSLDKPFGTWIPRLFVNGKASVLRRGAVYKAGENLQVQVHWQNGMRVWGTPLFTMTSLKKPRTGLTAHCAGYAHPRATSMNCFLRVDGFFSPPRTAGVCGRFDGNPHNDFVTRNGQVLASAGAQRQRHANMMASSWTIQPKDSIFALRQAQFQQNKGVTKKLTPLQAAKGNTALVSNAYAHCQQAKVLLDCVIDFIQSGGNKMAIAQNT